MPTKSVSLIAAAIFLGAVLHAQDSTLTSPTKHHQYKLIDLGTFGGPSSIIFGATGPVNNLGQVTSCADTAIPDPYVPNGNPYFGQDPLVQHAFFWSHGVLGDLK